MKNLSVIAEQVREAFEVRTQARDQALSLSRQIIRNCANAIRNIHRKDVQGAQEFLDTAKKMVDEMKNGLQAYPELYFAGYTQDAIKEYVEARCTTALIQNLPLPTPTELEVEYSTYMNGLAEVVGELRRHCLDILRQGYSEEAERLLGNMDDIYDVLVTLDFPDAITSGLRRQTDVARSLVERTRADLTLSLREQDLKVAMDSLREQVEKKV